MSYATRHRVTVATDALGDATAYTDAITGRLLNIIYTKPSSGGFDDGVDFAITADLSGLTLWAENDVNASKTVSPRQPVHGQDGSATTFEAIPAEIYLANERVKIVVSDGGDDKAGTFDIIVVGPSG